MIMSNHQNPVSVRPASQGEVSAAIEESIRQAFLNTGMPSVLVGTTNLAGELNKATVIEVAAPAVEISEDSDRVEVAEDVIIEDTATGQLNEVVAFIDRPNGDVVVIVRDESGVEWEITDTFWDEFYGEEGAVEILNAYDRTRILAMREQFNLTNA